MRKNFSDIVTFLLLAIAAFEVFFVFKVLRIPDINIMGISFFGILETLIILCGVAWGMSCYYYNKMEKLCDGKK